MAFTPRPWLLAAAPLLLVAGCGGPKPGSLSIARGVQGEITSREMPTVSKVLDATLRKPADSPHSDVGSVVLTTIPPVAQCTGKALPPARYWRLTDSQIAFTLQDAFGSTAIPELAGFRTDRFKDRFAGDPSRVAMTPDLVFSSLDSVGTVSAWIAENVADAKACRGAAQAGCLGTLRAKYAPLLWRRPLIDEETRALDALLAKAGAEGATQEERVRLLFDSLLLSPHFLYRSEIGEAASLAGRPVRRLDPYEVASVLSYTVWASLPDAPLLEAAARGGLRTPADIRAQMTRMMADPKARRGTQQVFDEWLGLRAVLTLPKDASYAAQLTADARKDLREEVTRFLDDALWTRDATLAELFSSNRTFLNERLAAYYGAPSPGAAGFSPQSLDPGKRAGILTSGAFVNAFSNEKGTGMVHRADFLLKHVLCSPMPPPPPGVVNASDMMVTGELTTRQRFERLHSANPACAACHRSLDPLGGAFESWDSIGRFRAFEGNLPIDSSGDLVLGGKSEFTYQTGAEFLQKLAPSERLAQCYSVKAYQAVAGVVPTEKDSCAVAKLHDANRASGFKPRSLLASFSDSDTLLYREERTSK